MGGALCGGVAVECCHALALHAFTKAAVLQCTAVASHRTPTPCHPPQAFLSMAESATTLTSTFAPYDQYEVVIPMEKAGSCLQEVGAEVYGPGKLWDGFRTPALVRFIT